MAQNSMTYDTSNPNQGDEHSHGGSLLGPILCWAVVFADIGTSVYYVPGILYGTNGIGNSAGFFVFLTMSVFVLLTLKYAEVTHRFPQGGGVVTVAAQAMNHWVGALGGMFILVDYFLTAAISCLSGMEYLSVVIPALDFDVVDTIIGPVHLTLLLITTFILVLLGILNWVGIKESAKVSLIGGLIAFVSDIVILITVFSHISFSYFFSLFPRMFMHHTFTPQFLLIGFAASFLAFSGLESISQLSPVMRTPRKKMAGIALLLVVLTIGLTSPLLTMLSTILQPREANDLVLSTQLISLLGGKWGGIILQTEVAVSASALLVFASNTAIIGAYHVFMALARMEFFPAIVLRRNKLRGTPHYSIALATGVPIAVLLLVGGRIDILGDMYAFGLLGAFSLTCLGLDIVRHRERKSARASHAHSLAENPDNASNPLASNNALNGITMLTPQDTSLNGYISRQISPTVVIAHSTKAKGKILNLWHTGIYYIGIVTTALVVLAWTTNLIYKHLATEFGGTVTLLGMVVAYLNYSRSRQQGLVPVALTHVEERMPGSILAVLTAGNGHNEAVIRSAINNANGNPVVFLFLGKPDSGRTPQLFEFVDPYLDDRQAKVTFGKAEHLALKCHIPSRRFVYRQQELGDVAHFWQIIHPHDTVVAAEKTPEIADINPDRIRYEVTTNGKVAHLLKRW